jgi:hypothetical protein
MANPNRSNIKSKNVIDRIAKGGAAVSLAAAIALTGCGDKPAESAQPIEVEQPADPGENETGDEKVKVVGRTGTEGVILEIEGVETREDAIGQHVEPGSGGDIKLPGGYVVVFSDDTGNGDGILQDEEVGPPYKE